LPGTLKALGSIPALKKKERKKEKKKN
jgi:hypothetical protein